MNEVVQKVTETPNYTATKQVVGFHLRENLNCGKIDIIVDSVITFTQNSVRLQTAPTGGCADIFGL